MEKQHNSVEITLHEEIIAGKKPKKKDIITINLVMDDELDKVKEHLLNSFEKFAEKYPNEEKINNALSYLKGERGAYNLTLFYGNSLY